MIKPSRGLVLQRTFDLEWCKAMMELVELMKIEFPQNVEQWPTVHLKFVFNLKYS